MDRGRIYELIAEDYLRDEELHYVLLLVNKAPMTVEVKDDELLIRLEESGGATYDILLRYIGGKVTLTYVDSLGGRRSTQDIEDYVASICDPHSFEESKCDRS